MSSAVTVFLPACLAIFTALREIWVPSSFKTSARAFAAAPRPAYQNVHQGFFFSLGASILGASALGSPLGLTASAGFGGS